MPGKTSDIISAETTRTLDGLFRERVRRTPKGVAYRYFQRRENRWLDLTWDEMETQVARCRKALDREPLKTGDRVAIWIHNTPQWVMLDQAALALSLVVVPIYENDRPENVAYILRDTGARLLLVEDEDRWTELLNTEEELRGLVTVLTLSPIRERHADRTLLWINDWLPKAGGEIKEGSHGPDDLATIVYTSGTTTHPKGVELTHRNILQNAYEGVRSIPIFREDRFLSFLPLSHTFERTVGYYIPIMAGATVAYARSIPDLREDMLLVRPTILISVPRVFERIYSKVKTLMEDKKPTARRLFDMAVEIGWRRFEWTQKRRGWTPLLLLWPILDAIAAQKIKKRLGGRLRMAISGGAPMPPHVTKFFLSFGVTLLQGYGLTETSPIISFNLPDNNDPASVGVPLKNLRLRIGKDDELLVKGPSVMRGYWNNQEETARVIDKDGWFHTGDKARLDGGRLRVIGRIKEIIVMANGEKVPTAEVEMAITADPLMEQVMVVGEGKSFLTALVVLNKDRWPTLTEEFGVDKDITDRLLKDGIQDYVLKRIREQLHAFPGPAKVRRVVLLRDPWTVENGLLTPTLKLRRNRVLKKYAEEIAELYKGHEV